MSAVPILLAIMFAISCALLWALAFVAMVCGPKTMAGNAEDDEGAGI